MESPLDICKHDLNMLLEAFKKLLNLIGEQSLPRTDREAISQFETNYRNFYSIASTPPVDIEQAITVANYAAIHAQALGTLISHRDVYTDAVSEAAKDLQLKATSLREKIESGIEFTLPYNFSLESASHADSVTNDSQISGYEKNIIELQAKLRSEIEIFERTIMRGVEEIEDLKRKGFENSQKSLNEVSALRGSIDDLKGDISQLQKYMTQEVEKAAEISKNAEKRSNEVNTQIDGLLGQTASKVLLVDYANTADTENKSANKLRAWSLICMAFTCLVLCLALYETLKGEFDWKQAIFKVFTAVALSVPAAYLARESAKHRTQEHINRRISLDLRAITPYIATLPSEEQNKIKSEVASKIFGVQESGNAISDNYPINIQELVKTIIDKIPTQK
ncbi:hypothetical protein GIV19_23230 [Pseudomonas syringae]|uniref:hypothetical protein n=1 Tax=Pseudomonas syringae TaxID=317 RepID=UPI001F42F246|nr:hypothetical protein [Pseudomonas syringae]MCF5710173.1 hypothetical protein [Pseudomonas syringae]